MGLRWLVSSKKGLVYRGEIRVRASDKLDKKKKHRGQKTSGSSRHSWQIYLFRYFSDLFFKLLIIFYLLGHPPAGLGNAWFSNAEMPANIFLSFAGISPAKIDFYISSLNLIIVENQLHFFKYKNYRGHPLKGLSKLELWIRTTAYW